MKDGELTHVVDCSASPIPISHQLIPQSANIRLLSHARYIVVVEKECVFKTLTVFMRVRDVLAGLFNVCLHSIIHLLSRKRK